jgi:hypothetical protein
MEAGLQIRRAGKSQRGIVFSGNAISCCMVLFRKKQLAELCATMKSVAHSCRNIAMKVY